MRRFLTAFLAVGALVVVAAPPAAAQEPLGFEIDPTEGVRGDPVAGQVDVADVAEFCVTDLGEFQARFQEVLSGPFAGGGATGELFDRFFPGGEFVFETHDQAAYSLTGFTVLGIAVGFDGAAEEALRQSFVMTFADIATQEPVGEMGNFDPGTGEGSVVVPDIEPGLWAVAAACVGPVLDVDLLEAGIRANGEFLQEIGAPADINSPEFAEFVQDFLGDEDATVFEFLAAIGPDLLQSTVEPDALGVQLFTVLDPRDVLADLIGSVEALDLQRGIESSLLRKLTGADRNLGADDVGGACDKLASFIDQVEAQSGKTIDAPDAEELIDAAERVRRSLGCGEG